MTDNKFNGFPFSLDEFDEETQMTVGLLSHDLVVQLRDKFNKHEADLNNKDQAMRMALLGLMAELMLDASILEIQIDQLISMYTRLVKHVDLAQADVDALERVVKEDPVIRMMLKTGSPSAFEIVAHLEKQEAEVRRRHAAQENSREKSSEIPTVDSDKL